MNDDKTKTEAQKDKEVVYDLEQMESETIYRFNRRRCNSCLNCHGIQENPDLDCRCCRGCKADK
jgi:hypothetical protein